MPGNTGEISKILTHATNCEKMSGMLEIRKIPSGTTRINPEVSGRWMQPREATRTQSGDQREAIHHTADNTTHSRDKACDKEFTNNDAAVREQTSGTYHQLVRGNQADGCNRAKQHAHRAEIDARPTSMPQKSAPIYIRTSSPELIWHHISNYFIEVQGVPKP